LQRSSSHNPTATRGPAYLSQLLIIQKIIVINLHVKNKLSTIDKHSFPSLTPNLTDGEVVSARD
jgi:hypothetical protein